MKKVYICSPYSGDTENNVGMAREYCRQAIGQGCLPIAPHLIYPQILDDSHPEERKLGLRLGLEILSLCDELWVCGDTISSGMRQEIAYAEELGKPSLSVRFAEPMIQMP